MNKTKSATKAGLMGIFLGWSGLHDFYLGKRIKGFVHLGLWILGGALILLANIAMSGASYNAGPVAMVYGIGRLILAGNGIWALAEAANIFRMGDVGLAQQRLVMNTSTTSIVGMQSKNLTNENIMEQRQKSKVVAGILGIFLGIFGAHWWYLGKTKKAWLHLGITLGAIALMIMSFVVATIVLSVDTSEMGFDENLRLVEFIMMTMDFVAGLMVSVNGIWAFFEAVMILVKGDAE